MTQLTIKNATDILNWYALEGSSNWGVWGNYPTLPVGASYHSFDNCHLRLLLSQDVEFGGEVFNCIIAGGRPSGSKVREVITLTKLKAICEANGASFVNEYMTIDKANELSAARLAGAKKTVANFEVMATYEWQEVRVREQVMTELNKIHIAKTPGSPLAKSVENYSLTIKNYCEKGEATIIVNAELASTNSKKTAGTYKAITPDMDKVEEIISEFTNERVASYSSNLNHHRKSLSELV